MHLARKWFLYSATNGGLLEHTESSHWGTRDACGKLTAETRHTEPKEGWWQLHSSVLFTLVFPQLSVEAVIHKGKWTGLAFNPWLCTFTFPCCYFQEEKKQGLVQICSQRLNPLIQQEKERVGNCPNSHYSTLLVITQHYSIHRQPQTGKPKHFFHQVYPDTVITHKSCWHYELLDMAVTQERLGGCYPC